MTDAQNLMENRKVLALCAKGPDRTNVQKALSAAGFKVSFGSSTAEAVALIADIKPIVFIHFQEAVDISQGKAMHQRLGRLDEHANLLRVLIVKEVNAETLAFANDNGIVKVLPEATAKMGLGQEVEMLLAGFRSKDGFRAIQRDIMENPQNYDQAKIDEAIEEAWEKYPHDPSVKMEFGGLSYRKDNLDEAIQVATDLVNDDPNNVRAMNLIARAHMKKGEFDKASEVLGQANALSPSNPSRLVMMGDAFLGSGKVELAEQCYEESLEGDPDNKEASSALGKLKISQGDYDQALSLFKDSLSEEESAGYFNNVAVMSVREGNLDDALKLYHHALQALKTKSHRAKVLFNIALTFRRKGDHIMAKKNLQKALKADDTHKKAAEHLEEIEKILSRPKKSA